MTHMTWSKLIMNDTDRLHATSFLVYKLRGFVTETHPYAVKFKIIFILIIPLPQI